MKDKPCELLVPLASHARLTGACRAELDHHRVTLVYTDGERETATLTDADIRAGRDSWVSLVSTVQAKRRVRRTQST